MRVRKNWSIAALAAAVAICALPAGASAVQDYSHGSASNCNGSPQDPTGAIFKDFTSASAARSIIVSLTGWNQGGAAGVFLLNVDGTHCVGEDSPTASATTNSHHYVMKLWHDSTQSVGTPAKQHQGTTNPCSGKWVVDSNGYVLGRQALENAFPNSYAKSESYWGNTQGMTQCEGSNVASDGNVAVIHDIAAPTMDSLVPIQPGVSLSPWTTNSRTPTFKFSVTPSGASAECKVDAGAWINCTSQWTYTGTQLSDGGHSFYVRVLDPGNRTDQRQTTFSFTVDSTAPTVGIDSGPSGITSNVRPAFTFHVGEGGTTLSCSIDTGAPNWGPCPSGAYQPPSDLTDGSYTFRVKSTDAAGNATVQTQSFALDLTPPVIATSNGLAQDPSGTPDNLHIAATDGTASVGAAGWQSGVRSIQLTMNGAPVASAGPQDCPVASGDCSLSLDYSVPLGSLTTQDLSFVVTATDEVGRTQTTQWTHTVAPQIGLVDDSVANNPSGPIQFVNSGDAPGQISQVQVVGADPQHFSISGDGCTGATLSANGGTCQLSVAHDAGNYSAAIRFLIAGQGAPEDVTISSSAQSGDTSLTFVDPSQANSPSRFAAVAITNAGESSATVTGVTIGGSDAQHFAFAGAHPDGCTGVTLAPAGANSCTLALSNDSGRYAAQLQFALANQDPENLDIYGDNPPGVVLTGQPPVDSTSTSASMSFNSPSQAASGFQCRWDSEDWSTCSSPASRTGLAFGSHSFEVRAVDASGATSRQAASFAWGIETPPGLTATCQGSSGSSQASTLVQSTFADAVAPTIPASVDGTQVDPTFSPNTYDESLSLPSVTGFPSGSTFAPVSVGCQASAGVTVDTDWGPLSLRPTMVAASAGAAQIVNGDAAVFGGAGPTGSADTIVRPTTLGFTDYLQLDSSAAGQAFSWRVSMPGGLILRELSDGSIAVLADPTPIAPSGPTPPPNEASDTSGDVTLANAAGLPAPGFTDPPLPTNANPGPAPNVQSAAATTLDTAPDAAAQFDRGSRSLAIAANQLSADDQTSLIATIPPPVAMDAAGVPVPVSLSFSGTVITESISLAPSTTFPVLNSALDATSCREVTPCGSFNPSAARAFALKYWNTPNTSFGEAFHPDCADFVSLILHAGHMKMVGGGTSQVQDVSKWFRGINTSYSWTVVQWQKQHMEQRHLGRILGPSHSWQVGDVAWFQFGNSHGTLGHADFVVNADNNDPTLVQHSTSAKETLHELHRHARGLDGAGNQGGVLRTVHFRPLYVRPQ